MPFDPKLGKRLEKIITQNLASIKGLTENRMMGGFGYFLNGNMCVGIHKDQLIIRVGKDTADEVIQRTHVGPMDFTGKVMKAWATIQPQAIQNDDQLKEYCQLAIDFVSSLPAKNKS